MVESGLLLLAHVQAGSHGYLFVFLSCVQVSKVANHRLERGIWTSPGAGDIRRCRAACERLVLLGDAGRQEEEQER